VCFPTPRVSSGVLIGRGYALLVKARADMEEYLWLKLALIPVISLVSQAHSTQVLSDLRDPSN